MGIVMFELQSETAPQGLAALGQFVEIRELPYGVMRETMAASDQPGQSAERLLAAALYVDGQPLGYEGLRALPGRFAGAITAALEQAMRMHGLHRSAAPDPEPAAGAAPGLQAGEQSAPND
jgi:hypothetical protein